MRAGGAITQQRKIQLCLKGATAQAQDGFKDAIRMARLNGSYTGQEYTAWGSFAVMMARVGKSLPEAEVTEAELEQTTQEDASVQSQIDAAVKAAMAAKDMDKKQHDAHQVCNNWKYTGKCHYERCRFSHDGEPGSTDQEKEDKEDEQTEDTIKNMLAIKAARAARAPRIQFMAPAAVSWKNAGQAE